MKARIISGSRTSEDLIRLYLSRGIDREDSDDGGSSNGVIPPIITPPNIQNGFYNLDRAYIHAHTTADYRTFLREAGYGDLDSCSHIDIAKNVLKLDNPVTEAARRASISIQANRNNYVASINQLNGRKLVEAIDHKLLTTQLMYGMFIPYIKGLSDVGNTEAQTTLNEMTNTMAEWLDDITLNQNTVKIGSKTKALNIPLQRGEYFDATHLNEYGYPNNVTSQPRVFRYWGPSANENAVFRSGSSELSLSLDGTPANSSDGLGVRLAKIFS